MASSLMVRRDFRPVIPLLFRLSLIALVILAGPAYGTFSPHVEAAPSSNILQTIGDFLSLGANTARELQTAIGVAGTEMRATLEALKENLDDLINTLSITYQKNLNVTLNSLDAFTRSKLIELEGLIGQINQALQDDITLATEAARAIIRQVSSEVERLVKEVEQSLTRLIIVGGETAAWVVDRGVNDAIVVISLVLLGLGFLLFIWLLFSRRLPQGLARVMILLFMAAYVALFGAVGLFPPARGYAMIYTGIGLEKRLEKVERGPYILRVVPDTIVMGDTQEVDVWGNTLRPNDQSPTAKIADQPVPVLASSDEHAVLNVVGLNVAVGSRDVVLAYEGRDGPRDVVHVKKPTPIPVPPDLIVSSFSIDPSEPEEGKNAHAVIGVRNQGGSPAGRFVVRWKPTADMLGNDFVLAGGLKAGASQEVAFDYAYSNPGAFQSLASVDVNNEVVEANEANNTAERNVVVKATPPPPTCVETEYISDETGGPTLCPSGYAVKGVRCKGDYCDEMSLRCCPYMSTADYGAVRDYSEWISEEGPNNVVTINNGFLSGLECKDDYCDSIRMRMLISPKVTNEGQCYWGTWISEETGGGKFDCPEGSFGAGMKCDGDYCDNVSLRCCRYAIH